MLGAELFHVPAGKIADYPAVGGGLDQGWVSWPTERSHGRHPSRLVVALEATAMGCRWLREQWAALGKLLDEGLTGRRPTGCGRSGCWAVSRWTWSTRSR